MLERSFTLAAFPEEQKNSVEILYTHAVFKGVEFGPIAGLLISAPFALYKKSYSILKRGVTLGFYLGPLVISGMVYRKMLNKESIEWQDRAWRLQRNTPQNQLDDIAVLGISLYSILTRLKPGTSFRLGLGSMASVGTFAFLKKMDLLPRNIEH